MFALDPARARQACRGADSRPRVRTQPRTPW
jgi:hypothetical protein